MFYKCPLHELIYWTYLFQKQYIIKTRHKTCLTYKWPPKIIQGATKTYTKSRGGATCGPSKAMARPKFQIFFIALMAMALSVFVALMVVLFCTRILEKKSNYLLLLLLLLLLLTFNFYKLLLIVHVLYCFVNMSNKI
jgi:hypothetical protein